MNADGRRLNRPEREKMYGMKITYESPLYKGVEVTRNVFGEIVVRDGCLCFASGGSRYAVEIGRVKKIEALPED